MPASLSLKVHQDPFAFHPALFQALNDCDLAVFDYDGVIGDTEPYQMKAFTNFLNKKTKAHHDFHMIAKQMLGKPEQVIIREFKESFGLIGDINQLVQERGEFYRKSILTGSLRPDPVVQSAVDFVRNNDTPRIILSNGRHPVITEFNNHWNIGHKFNEIYAIDNRATVDKTQFLLDYAAERGIDPHKIVMFEDSVATLTRMQEHGIRGVYVRHSFNCPDFQPQSGAIIHLTGPA